MEDIGNISLADFSNAVWQRDKMMKVLLIAEDVVWYDWSNNDSDAVHTMEQLRLAVAEARAAVTNGESK